MITKHPQCNVTSTSRAPLNSCLDVTSPVTYAERFILPAERIRSCYHLTQTYKNSASITELLRGKAAQASIAFSAQVLAREYSQRDRDNSLQWVTEAMEPPERA